MRRVEGCFAKKRNETTCSVPIAQSIVVEVIHPYSDFLLTDSLSLSPFGCSGLINLGEDCRMQCEQRLENCLLNEQLFESIDVGDGSWSSSCGGCQKIILNDDAVIQKLDYGSMSDVHHYQVSREKKCPSDMGVLVRILRGENQQEEC